MHQLRQGSTPFQEREIQGLRDLGLMVTLLLIGSGLRLIWPADMEWKGDEIWMFETARGVVEGQLPWPWLGMPSSTQLQNPGMSVWPFIAMAYGAKTPVAMVRWVQWLNVVTLWLLFGFCYWQMARHPRERLLWLWGTVLAAVSPIGILFSRKLWTTNVLPIFCILILIGHWFRDKRWGAFLWGVVGSAIGQVHMSGFFLAAGLWLWTLYSDGRQGQLRRTRWLSWLLGAGLGLIPLIPWLIYVASATNDAARSWVGVMVPKFFVHWFTTGLGINLGYSLGTHFWSDFLPQPILFGVPTYLVGLIHGALLGVGIWGLVGWVRSCDRPLARVLTPANSATGYYTRSHGMVTGLLFTLYALNVTVHYVFVAFPVMYVWLASVFARYGLVWRLMLIGQLLISISFLLLIHTTGGFADADYGIVYRLQPDVIKYP